MRLSTSASGSPATRSVVVDHAPSRRRRGLVAPALLAVGVPGRPVVGRHGERLDAQRGVVGGVDGKPRPGGRVEHHEVAPGRLQRRGGRAHVEAERRAGLELLAEDVAQAAEKRDAVAGATAGEPADRERVAPALELQARQLRLDADLTLAQRLRVDRVRKLDPPRVEGRAAPVPAALAAAHAEGAVGPEAPALGRVAPARALGRGRPGPDAHVDGGVWRQSGLGAERDEAPGLGRPRHARHDAVRLHLGVRREPQRERRPAAGAELQGREHGGGVDALVEAGEEQRVAPSGAALGMPGHEPRRRRVEAPGLGRGEPAAEGARRARRDRRAIPRRHREAPLGLEDERARADPAPLARRLGLEPQRHVRERQRRVRVERQHRLRERHGELRRERDVALGHPAQHRERARSKSVGPRHVARRGRERRALRAPGARRRQGRLAQRERLDARLGAKRRQPVEHAVRLGPATSREAGGRATSAGASAEAPPSLSLKPRAPRRSGPAPTRAAAHRSRPSHGAGTCVDRGARVAAPTTGRDCEQDRHQPPCPIATSLASITHEDTAGPRFHSAPAISCLSVRLGRRADGRRR